jgi:Ser/Thr protein kinase RdoA (MazF antagonist)
MFGRATEVASEVRFAIARAGHAEVLPPLIASGEVPTRVAHNDAKIGNVLFDRESGEALAVVDLDTVMPGTLLNDVGDLIRSMASPDRFMTSGASRIAVSPN